MKKYLIFTFFLLSSLAACCQDRIILGDERPDIYLPLLEGRRVALFSNQSGIVGDKVTGSALADDVA